MESSVQKLVKHYKRQLTHKPSEIVNDNFTINIHIESLKPKFSTSAWHRCKTSHKPWGTLSVNLTQVTENISA